MADATVTTNTLTMKQLPMDGNMFYASLYSANWSTVGDVLAAVTGSSHYITRFIITVVSTTDATVTIGSGSGVDVVTTAHFGLIGVPDAGGSFEWKAPDGMGAKCTDSTEIALETSAAMPLWIYIEGKTCLN